MVGQGRRRDLEPVLELADRHPGLARTDQRTIDLEPGRVTKRFEVGRGVIEFHVNLVTVLLQGSYHNCEIFEIQADFVDPRKIVR